MKESIDDLLSIKIMYNKFIFIFVTMYLILMLFLCREYQTNLIAVLVIFLIIWGCSYYESKQNDKLLQIKLNNNLLEIINKQEHISIAINKIKSCESIIYAHQSTTLFFGYGLAFSHKFVVHTTSKDYEFEFPEKYMENWLGVTLFIDYNEVFELFDLNLPDYKYTFIGNVNHINKVLKYYLKYHKRPNLIKQYYLYFIDLPPTKKLKNIILLIMLILFLAVNILLLWLYIYSFLNDHGVFF